ncbi:hypothetical protein GGC65_004152 [Sphingopyxis sp. OAS728]|nr:hypothetical protein [Sphingopyxis sp. OAS728]
MGRGNIRYLKIAIAAVAFACPMTVAYGQDGHICKAQAFSIIGGLHARGIGSVSLWLDSTFQPTSATLEYSLGARFTAIWKLPKLKVDDSAILSSIRIVPLRHAATNSFSVTVRVDDTVVATRNFRKAANIWTEFDEKGRALRAGENVELISDASAPWIADLKGHRTVAYSVVADGQSAGGDLILLPDMAKQRGTFRAALNTTKGQARRRECGQFFSVGKSLGMQAIAPTAEVGQQPN